MPKGDNDDTRLTRSLAVIVGIVVIVIVIGIIWFAVLGYYHSHFGDRELDTDPKNWGAFGDYVGGLVNPLIGSLTLIALVVTIAAQAHLLRLTRQQATAANNAVEQAKNAHFVELQVARQQAFESSFIDLLGAVNARAAALEFDGQRVEEDGQTREVFFQGLDAAAQHVGRFHAYLHVRADHPGMAGVGLYKYQLRREDEPVRFDAPTILEGWRAYFHAYAPQLGPLLQSLINHYNYVVTSAPSGERTVPLNNRLREIASVYPEAIAPFVHQASFYANLATDHRTRFELKLLAFYAAASDANSKARLVVREFDVTRSLRNAGWWADAILPALDPREPLVA